MSNSMAINYTESGLFSQVIEEDSGINLPYGITDYSSKDM